MALGYQRRVLPRPARVQVDPSLEGGAIVGRALARGGNMVAAAGAEARDRRDQRELARETSRQGVAYEEAVGRVQSRILELRAEGGPDGHEDAVEQILDEEMGGFLDGIEDRRVADRFADRVARARAGAMVSGQAWTAEQNAKRQAMDHETMVATQANRLSTMPLTDDALQAEIDATFELIDGYDMPENVRAALKDEADKRLRLGAFEFVMTAQPGLALEAIDKGALDGLVDEKGRRAYRERASTLNAKLQLEATRARKANEKEMEAFASVRIEDVNNEVLVDPALLQADLEFARAAGDPKKIQDIERAIAVNGVNHRFGNADPAELREALRVLEQEEGWRDDRQKVAAHGQMEKLAAAGETRLDNDPVGLLIEQGGAQGLPPIDLDNPDVMARYFAAGEAAQKRYGTASVVYLPAQVAEQVASHFEAASDVEKVTMLAGLSRYGRARAGGLVRQIAPNDPWVATALDLVSMNDRGAGQKLALEAVAGRALLQGDGKLFDDTMAAPIRARQAEAFAGLTGQQRQGLIETAKHIYASRAAKAGLDRFDSDLYEQALSAAMGASGGKGGLGETGEGNPFILPRGYSETTVNNVWSRATTKQFVESAYGGTDFPKWPGSDRKVTKGDVLRMTPVLRFDDNGRAVYALQAADGGLMESGRHDGVFLIDLRRLIQRVVGDKRAAEGQ